MRTAITASLFGAYLIALCPGTSAADLPVDLELVLAVDVSRSVDDEEAALQRSGYIKAFRHPSILDAITHGPFGRIAVTYFEWAGYARIRPVVPWMVITDRASAEAFVRILETDEPEQGRRTSISGAIDYGAASFENNGFTARRRVIDISGDGANNSGGIVTVARDRAIKDGITINGLPIVNGRPTMSGWAQVENLDLFYRDCVIGGPGAFYVVAKDFADFPRAVLRKLMLEIAGLTPSQIQKPRLFWRAQMKPARQSPPCDIGEKRRRERWMNGDDFYDSDPNPLPGPTPAPRR
ncbi:MAG: DUF1194 domain-containing protein [Rhodospirillaceae bacterium]|nr:DUF1194 domain-containing protein [Rhodospirillaceae bacterium]